MFGADGGRCKMRVCVVFLRMRYFPGCLQDGETALHFAATSWSDGKEKLTFLLAKGAGVNIQSSVSVNI